MARQRHGHAAIVRRNARIVELYSAGTANREIATILRVSVSLVSKVLFAEACTHKVHPPADNPWPPEAMGSADRGGRKGAETTRRKAAAGTPDNPLTSDVDYTDEQVAWMFACEAYAGRHRKRFLTKCDYLAVAKSLGYKQ